MHSITIVLHKTSFWSHIKMPKFLNDFIVYVFLKCLFVDMGALWKSCTNCDEDGRVKCVWYGRFVGYWILRLQPSGIWCDVILQISTCSIHCTALQCNLYRTAEPCVETCDNEICSRSFVGIWLFGFELKINVSEIKVQVFLDLVCWLVNSCWHFRVA